MLFFVGPVIDLTGIDEGLEGTLDVGGGDGEQAWIATHKGMLRRDEEEGFVFETEKGKRYRLNIGDVARYVGHDSLRIGVTAEKEFLRAYTDCFDSHICSNWRIAHERPQQFYRGLISRD